MNIDLSSFLEGPNAIVFGSEILEPIKALDSFAKNITIFKLLLVLLMEK